jgi:L-histidine N-alpha-methyltransferase
MSTELQTFQPVYVHPSQFPQKVYQDYIQGFINKKIDHKFHYDSVKQSQKWLRIHDSYSPARNNDDGILCYQRCFQHLKDKIGSHVDLDLIGLGCGGGEKDKSLLITLAGSYRSLTYYPVDVSLSLSLISAQKVRDYSSNVEIMPIVCDLLSAGDLVTGIQSQQAKRSKIVTFFGMIPNFLPHEILPILARFIDQEDILLMSANLSPGEDYLAGIDKILFQYDNDLTRDWLMTILLDVGLHKDDGEICFSIKDDLMEPGLKRINCTFKVSRKIDLNIDNNRIQWQEGDEVQLFFSYRYTSPKLETVLRQYQLSLVDYWEGANQEEGVYLIRKSN